MNLHSPVRLQSKESLARALSKAPDRLEVALPMQTGCGGNGSTFKGGKKASASWDFIISEFSQMARVKRLPFGMTKE